MPSVEDEALVLRQIPYGDHDAIVSLLSGGHGRVDCFARGARRRRPRWGAALEPFTLIEATWRTARGDGLARLQGAEPVRVHHSVRRDLNRLTWASAACEAIGQLCPEGLPAPEVFALILTLLKRLSGAAVPADVWPAFLLQLMTVEGFAPELSCCVACGRSAPDGRPVVVLADRGGVVCRSCRLGLPGGLRLEAFQVEALRRLARTHLSDLGPEGPAGPGAAPAPATSEDAEVLARWLERTLELHTGRPLRSLDLLRPVRRTPEAPRPLSGASELPAEHELRASLGPLGGEPEEIERGP